MSKSLIADIWCNSGDRVYKAVNLMADDCNLDRIDTGCVKTSCPLNIKHELIALRAILDANLFKNEIIHFSKCGSRTDFVAIDIDEVQLHECMNTKCAHVFIASPDYDSAFDEIDEGLDQSLDPLYAVDERWSDLTTVN